MGVQAGAWVWRAPGAARAAGGSELGSRCMHAWLQGWVCTTLPSQLRPTSMYHSNSAYSSRRVSPLRGGWARATGGASGRRCAAPPKASGTCLRPPAGWLRDAASCSASAATPSAAAPMCNSPCSPEVGGLAAPDVRQILLLGQAAVQGRRALKWCTGDPWGRRRGQPGPKRKPSLRRPPHPPAHQPPDSIACRLPRMWLTISCGRQQQQQQAMRLHGTPLGSAWAHQP